jgi:hypothetical protein
MPRIGPVAVTNTLLAARTLAGASGSKLTVTLPSNPTGPWTAKAVFSDGVEMAVETAALVTGTRALTVTVANQGVYAGRTVTGIAVDY